MSTSDIHTYAHTDVYKHVHTCAHIHAKMYKEMHIYHTDVNAKTGRNTCDRLSDKACTGNPSCRHLVRKV